MFVRVVHRRGWDLELVSEGRKLNFGSREAALRAAFELSPEWIEVGEIVPPTPLAPQHHSWQTLRRTASGEYADSGLSWARREDSP